MKSEGEISDNASYSEFVDKPKVEFFSAPLANVVLVDGLKSSITRNVRKRNGNSKDLKQSIDEATKSFAAMHKSSSL
jgi:hypothetical protein